MKNTFLILLLFLGIQNTLAFTVEGIVLDKQNNLPLSDAVILAISENKVLSSANSNAKGEFKLALKKDKNIRLEVVKNRYKTENADIVTNQEFINANPYITIKLSPRDTKVEEKQQEMLDQKPENMEDIGNISELPEGYKIIEAVPIKEKEVKRSGLNVRVEVKEPVTNVNVDILKDEFNKSTASDALNPNHKFLTSYFKEGAVYYNVAKAFLTSEVKEIIKGMALKLKNDPNSKLVIKSYSDANQELKIADFICKMRTEEIVNLLMNEGVNFAQLDIKIYGHQLIKNGCEEGIECSFEQHQENRKVELSFVQQ